MLEKSDSWFPDLNVPTSKFSSPYLATASSSDKPQQEYSKGVNTVVGTCWDQTHANIAILSFIFFTNS